MWRPIAVALVDGAGPLGEIIVVAAALDELAEHDLVLAALDKGVKGECVWRKYSPQG